MLKLGIVGVGGIAGLHIDNILTGKCPDIEIAALADRRECRREWAAEKVPGAKIFSEGSDLIKRCVRGGSDCRAALPAPGADNSCTAE